MIIEKNPPPAMVQNFEVRPTFNVLHSKSFDPNTQQYHPYAQDVDKIELPGLLMELSKKYFKGLGQHNAPKNPPKKPTPLPNREVYQCSDCHTVYDQHYGDAQAGIAKNTPFAQLPNTYCCPVCSAPKSHFKAAQLQLKA